MTSTTTTTASGLLLERVGFGDAAVPYETGWALQRERHDEVVAGTRASTVLLLEHPPVYTAGRRTEPGDRPVDGTPVVDVDRGGKITWHGPGQLVGYPIVRLPDPVDVVAHVRRLEDVLLGVCDDLGVAAVRVPGRSGVWIAADERGPDRKVAAIGVRVARGVTMHGFALTTQLGSSVGERIEAALGRALDEGRVPVLVGSDVVSLVASDLNDAFDALHEREAVFAPTEDGGYALVGLSRRVARLFEEMPWGRDSLMAATRRRLQENGVRWSQLRTLWDVDEEPELRRWLAG